MFRSVDTISLIDYCHLPSEKTLEESQFTPRLTKFGRKWVNNGIEGTYEPRITIYPTWRRNYRMRIDLELSKLFYGHNVTLLDESEITDALNLISKNVEKRTSIKFDAFNTPVCRIDYAVNKYLDSFIARKFIKRYFTYKISHLIRHVVESETVYFENESRVLSLYNKHLQMLKKKNIPLEVIHQAIGLIRLEYRLKDEKAVNRFAERLGFENVLAKTLLSQDSIKMATDEMCDLLSVETFEYSEDSQMKRFYAQTGDIKQAMSLSGFTDAIKEFGEDFYLLEGMKISKSTYDRLDKQRQKAGL